MDSERLSVASPDERLPQPTPCLARDCPTKDIVSQRAAGVRGSGAVVNGCAHSRLPSQARRAYDAMLIGSLYLRDPPLDVVIDLLASAGAVLLVSLSLVTRRGLCLCSA